MGDQTHVSTRVMGTYGYAAPEYVMTGELFESIYAELFCHFIFLKILKHPGFLSDKKKVHLLYLYSAIHTILY